MNPPSQQPLGPCLRERSEGLNRSLPNLVENNVATLNHLSIMLQLCFSRRSKQYSLDASSLNVDSIVEFLDSTTLLMHTQSVMKHA